MVTHKKDEIKNLKRYFKKRPDIAMAFLFGSQKNKKAGLHSDWDIGVYFNPASNRIEREEETFYPQENQIWRELESILKNEVDMVVLNRAPSSLVFAVLGKGMPLAINKKTTYLDLLQETSYDAIDFIEFCNDFYKIKQRAQSLSVEDKAMLLAVVDFLSTESEDFKKFRQVTWQEYQSERPKRREIERWVENIVNASLDIAKILLASEKKDIPATYQETLRLLGTTNIFSPDFADRFSKWARLRNILAHRYLDLKWEQIHKFAKEAEQDVLYFIEKIRLAIT